MYFCCFFCRPVFITKDPQMCWHRTLLTPLCLASHSSRIFSNYGALTCELEEGECEREVECRITPEIGVDDVLPQHNSSSAVSVRRKSRQTNQTKLLISQMANRVFDTTLLGSIWNLTLFFFFFQIFSLLISNGKVLLALCLRCYLKSIPFTLVCLVYPNQAILFQ